MITRIKQFFESNLLIKDVADEAELEHRLKLACAALMLEIIHVDEQVTDEEENRVRQLLQNHYGLDHEETQSLLELAHDEKHTATDYYQFTSLINNNYSQSDKIKLIQHLWELAYADNNIDRFEEHLVRKLAELLHVPHAVFIKTRHDVIENSN